MKPIDFLNSLESLHSILCSSPQDFSLTLRDAFMYQIVVGWSDSALEEIKNKFIVGDSEIERWRELRMDFIRRKNG